MKTILFPEELLNYIKSIAEQESYPEIVHIINREPLEKIDLVYGERAISLSDDDAQALANLASIEHVKAALKYPYWSDDHPKYNEDHEDKYFEVQANFFQKVIQYLSDFELKTF